MVSSLRALIASFSPRRRTQLLLLVGLMLLGAVAEVVSLGAVVPFLAVLADPAQVVQRPWLARVVATLGLSDAQDIRWELTLLFGSAAVFAGAVRFALVYATAKINFGLGHELAAEVYRRTLYQPYEAHVARNSSEVVAGMAKVDIVVWVIFSLLSTVSAFLMALFIVAGLLLIDPFTATAAVLGFGGIYAAVSLLSRKRLALNGQVVSRTYNMRVQAMQEGLGGIRDVLLDQAQPVFSARFNRIDLPLREALASNSVIAPSPRFVVEALGMVLIGLLAYQMTVFGGGVSSAIPILGALALGAQRLMPLLQTTYQGWVYVASNREVLADVVAMLKQPMPQELATEVATLPFQREIRFEQVSFRYQAQLAPVLHQLDLRILKGARVGLIGVTGSGKSTTMDLLMGLLQPTTGRILVDDVPLVGADRLGWQRHVAHVPQSIFLSDASFAENIAFGVPAEDIDMGRVRRAAQRAQIAHFIESGPEGYAAMVGERGVRLSGGQRQRIGIARALYKSASVLVFDEATSALDGDTEEAVMQAIEGLGDDLTIVLIAHRISTLRLCDTIYRLDQGKISGVGTYDHLVSSNGERESHPA